mmetsp:Transcript_6539/g.14133  ORF Transcript_6539/g.14133 Transcript_6539/m.14133 type:complete len:98 (+) Transcript_6539:89-382(+)
MSTSKLPLLLGRTSSLKQRRFVQVAFANRKTTTKSKYSPLEAYISPTTEISSDLVSPAGSGLCCQLTGSILPPLQNVEESGPYVSFLRGFLGLSSKT